jgi:hypothetical protein
MDFVLYLFTHNYRTVIIALNSKSELIRGKKRERGPRGEYARRAIVKAKQRW